MAFSEDLHLFAGLSGTEDFFELWEERQLLVVSIEDDEDVRDSFQRTDIKFMRTAAILQQEALGHRDGEDNTPLRQGGSGEIRLRSGRREWKMWNGLHELEKVHGTSNTQQKR